jgi:CrcB protein
MATLYVALAGAAGAVARYRLGVLVGVRSFPWTTLAINVVGSFALALVLAGPAASRWSPATATAVSVGLLGAFTTFSTFSYETVELVRTDRPAAALAYVLASLLGGLLAAAAGYALGRSLA